MDKEILPLQVAQRQASILGTDSSTLPKPFIFVLMPFSSEFDDVYQLGIKPACKEAEAYCERLDEQIFSEGMLERIYNQVSKADLIVADMSGQNPNVFYEVGYAHALGKTVILLTKESSDIPFDLKHRFHLVYGSSITKLKDELRSRVSFYLSNPRIPLDATEGIQLFIGGKPLRSGDSYDFAAEEPSPSGYLRTHCVNVQVSAHNPGMNSLENIRFTPVLITPAIFAHAIQEVGGGGTIEFSSIPLPGGLMLHRPLDGIDLDHGGWDSVVFALRLPSGQQMVESLGTHTFILRVLGRGPAKDFEFKANVEL
jgi:hypothetical protein